MVKLRMAPIVWIAAIFGLIAVNSSKSQNVPPNEAIKDLSIVSGGECNQQGVPGILQYLRNRNKSKSIVVRGCSVSTGRYDSTTFKRCMRMPPKRYFGEKIAKAA